MKLLPKRDNNLKTKTVMASSTNLKKATKYFSFAAILLLSAVYFYTSRPKPLAENFTIYQFNISDVKWWQVENKLPLPSEKYFEPQPMLRIEKVPVFENVIKWRITAPTDEPANQDEAEANVRNLLSLNAIKRIGSIKNANKETQNLLNSKTAPRISFAVQLKGGNINTHVIIVGAHLPEIDAYEIIADKTVYYTKAPFVLALMKSSGMLAKADFLQIEPKIISWVASYHKDRTNSYIISRSGLNYFASPLGNEQKVLTNLKNLKSGMLENNNKVKFNNTKLEKVIQAIGFLNASAKVTSIRQRKDVMKSENVKTTFHIRTDSLVRQREIVLCIFEHDYNIYATAEQVFNRTIENSKNQKAFIIPNSLTTFEARNKNIKNYCSNLSYNSNNPLYSVENKNSKVLASTLFSLTK